MVEWERWEGVYERILRDFGYSRAEDEAARDELDALLDGKRLATPDDLRSILEGAEVIVYGPHGDDETDWHYGGATAVKVAADAATRILMRHDVVPDLIVTDLDGDVWSQVEANRRGAVAVVHAHGDNRAALREWVPRLHGAVMGTTQAAPRGRVHDFGGFTDGDRAVFLADHFRARQVTLVGFDFEDPAPKPGRDPETKKRKLAWARALIGSVSTPVRRSSEGGPFSY